MVGEKKAIKVNRYSDLPANTQTDEEEGPRFNENPYESIATTKEANNRQQSTGRARKLTVKNLEAVNDSVNRPTSQVTSAKSSVRVRAGLKAATLEILSKIS